MPVGKTETRRVKPRTPKGPSLKQQSWACLPQKFQLLNMSSEWLFRGRCSVHDGTFLLSLSQKQFASACQDELGYAAVTDSSGGLKQKTRFPSSVPCISADIGFVCVSCHCHSRAQVGGAVAWDMALHMAERKGPWPAIHWLLKFLPGNR